MKLPPQVESASVARIDSDGSLQFRTVGPNAPVLQRVPVEGRYSDGAHTALGPAVNLLLHVVNGRLHELEVYKDDGSVITVCPFEVAPRSDRGVVRYRHVGHPLRISGILQRTIRPPLQIAAWIPSGIDER